MPLARSAQVVTAQVPRSYARPRSAAQWKIGGGSSAPENDHTLAMPHRLPTMALANVSISDRIVLTAPMRSHDSYFAGLYPCVDSEAALYSARSTRGVVDRDWPYGVTPPG